MQYELRKPQFKVTIVRPRYTSATYLEDVVKVFSSDPANTALTGYQYEMSLQSFDSPFALSFAPYVVNEKGETMIDVVQLLDLVKIEEHGELKYIGVVNSVRYAARMSESGPDRMITVQGYGIAGVVNQFAMLLDQVLLSDATTTVTALETKLRALVSDLSSKYDTGTSMITILEAIRIAFKSAMEKIGGFTPNTGMFSVMEKYLGFANEVYGDETNPMTKYPLALSVFSYGAITLGQAWEGVVAKPFYEMFTRWEPLGEKWLIVIRPTPFMPSRWLSLKKTDLNPLHVEAFDCGYSADDVKTFFFAYLSGGSTTYEMSRSLYQKTAIKKDSEKWALYGYRPLEASFRYVDQVKLQEDKRNLSLSASRYPDINGKPETVSDEKLMDKYSSMLQQWFGRADEMLTGSIDVMTMKDGPKVGEVVAFNGAEFYVESLSAQWSYGGKQVTSLKVTRGGLYNRQFATGTGASGEDVATGKNWWFKKAAKLGSRLELKTGAYQ